MTEKLVTLTLPLPAFCVAGCLDYVSVLGGDENDKIEVIVSETLIALIMGFISEKLIPNYETDEEALERISKHLKLDENVPEDLAEIQDFLTKPSEKQIEHIPESEENQLDFSEEISEEKSQLTFQQILEIKSSASDPLVNSVRGKSQDEEALASLYSEIPRSLWGSDRAKEMLSNLIIQE